VVLCWLSVLSGYEDTRHKIGKQGLSLLGVVNHYRTQGSLSLGNPLSLWLSFIQCLVTTHADGHHFNSTWLFAAAMAQVYFGSSLGFRAKTANPPKKLLGGRVSTKYWRIPSLTPTKVLSWFVPTWVGACILPGAKLPQQSGPGPGQFLWCCG